MLGVEQVLAQAGATTSPSSTEQGAAHYRLRHVSRGVVQAEPVWFDTTGTLRKTLQLINEAADAGARIIAFFPEVWFPGYPMFLWLDAVAAQMPMIGRYHASFITTDGPKLLAVRTAAGRGASPSF